MGQAGKKKTSVTSELSRAKERWRLEKVKLDQDLKGGDSMSLGLKISKWPILNYESTIIEKFFLFNLVFKFCLYLKK